MKSLSLLHAGVILPRAISFLGVVQLGKQTVRALDARQGFLHGIDLLQSDFGRGPFSRLPQHD